MESERSQLREAFIEILRIYGNLQDYYGGAPLDEFSQEVLESITEEDLRIAEEAPLANAEEEGFFIINNAEEAPLVDEEIAERVKRAEKGFAVTCTAPAA